MIDVTLVVSSSQSNASLDSTAQKFLVMQNGENKEFNDCPNKIVEIPEDYYLDLDIRYLFDDGSEIYNRSPRVVISDESYFCHYVTDNEGNKSWRIEWNNHNTPHKGRPYYGLAGRHQIKISVFDDTDEFSEYRLLVEVLATRNSATEIRSMLDAIDEDYNEIEAMCINSNITSGSSFIDLLDEAEDIYNNMSSMWNRLLMQMRKSFAPQLVIKPNGVPNSPEAIHWICANTDALGYCQPSEQDFTVNNFPVRTDFAAEEVVIAQYDLFENKVILGFFEQMEAKLADVRAFITEKRNVSETGKSPYFPEYIRYAKIVDDYSVNVLARHEQRVWELQDKYYRLYDSMRKFTGIKAKVRPIYPKITPFVARTKVYLDVFTEINAWYHRCKTPLVLNDFALHFIKIDKLYEFTVLTKIVNGIKELGGTLLSKEWHNMNAKVFGGVAEDRPNSDPFNYYHWQFPRREFTLELWYEPKIKTLDYANDGDLVVVKNLDRGYRRDYYLTPDFLFRINWRTSGVVDYLIMDAKYSSDNTVNQQSIPNLIEKYLYTLNTKNKFCGNHSIKAVWALYSRGARSQVSFYNAPHTINGDYCSFPSLEGIRVGVRDTDSFKKNLALLLFNLKRMHSYEHFDKTGKLTENV